MLPEAFFSGPGLDRADHLRSDPSALAALAAREDSLQLMWADGAPLLDDRGRLAWQAWDGACLFLGLDGESPRFSGLPLEGPTDPRAHFSTLGLLDPVDAPVFAAALSLANWHRRHGYCAACGGISEANRGGWSRKCTACQAEHYPRVDPVVIMLAEHQGRVLLGRQPHYPPGRYSALAGFVEVGETIEAAVARELFEEAGIRVQAVNYVASQPWPFPSSLMIGATATAIDDRLTVDTTELDDARWFTRDEVAAAMDPAAGGAFLAPPRFAIAHTLLEHWLRA